jgi:hypothetical protein
MRLLVMLSAIACSGDDGGGGNATDACFAPPDCSTSGATVSGSATASTEPGGTASTEPSGTASTEPSSETTAGTSASESSASTSESSGSGGPTGNASAWIIEHFADAPVVSGDFAERMQIEAPALVMDATNTNAKYAFETRDDEKPTGPEVGFVNVEITDLVSTDGFGGAIQTSYSPGAIVYIANMYVEPNWPAWQDYDTTNYDGIVLDESAEFYAEDLTIANWNADSAIDIKAPIAQFVRLETEGGGNRTLRFWATGPHYLVESNVNNPSGTVLWFSDCDATTLNVYDSTFNGAPQVAPGDIECDNGSAPNIVYLDTDPRTTGEMHPMFGAP